MTGKNTGHSFNTQRRQLLGVSIGLGLSHWLALPVLAESSVPVRQRGNARIGVRAFGAVGDGVHDDTGAMQRAIDALPPAGGTVEVPGGRYLIDPLNTVRLRSNMHLELAADASLLAIPNAEKRAYMLLVQDIENVEVSGGTIIGERDSHLGSEGEWGHGLAMRGARNVTIRDLRVSRCWGDGISVASLPPRMGQSAPASEDVVLARVVCDGNRRQGLTIGHAFRVRVYDSEFSNTSGTPPSAGIDIEPDGKDLAGDILISGCRFRNNHGPGIQVYRYVSDVTIDNCLFGANHNAGVLVADSERVLIRNNRFGDNGPHPITVHGHALGVSISGNRFAEAAWRSKIAVGTDAADVVLGAGNAGG